MTKESEKSRPRKSQILDSGGEERAASARSSPPAVANPPRSALERPVFSIADRLYRWEDVLAASREWGGIAAIERQAAEGLAALARTMEEGPLLDDTEVEAEADHFRHGRNLLAAEEMKAWLARWDLESVDWFAYLRRALARARLDGDLEETLARYPPDPQAVADALWPQAVCSGALGDWAWKLAGRVAAADALGVSPGSDFVALENASAECSERALTPEAKMKVLERRRSDWVRVECTVLELPDEWMAREAALCVRHDGLSLPEVAARAGTQVEERTFWVDEAGPELAQSLLSAAEHDIVGPIAIGDRFVLAVVDGKRAPSLDDPVVQEQVQEEVRRRAIEAEIDSRIRWHERF